MNTIGIGLIGTGFMGQAHADAFRRVALLYGNEVPAISLVTLADKERTVAESAAKRYGFEKATDNWRELLDDERISLVVIFVVQITCTMKWLLKQYARGNMYIVKNHLH